MSSLLQVQPFKGPYLLYEAVTTTFVRVPLWFIFALPRNNRPKATWSLRRSLLLWWRKHWGAVSERSGRWWKEPNYLALELGANIKGVWVNPVPHLIVGEVKEWAVLTGVEPVRVPGYWLEKPGATIPVDARAQAGEKVLYALHGGGYAACSAHPDDGTSNVPRGILQHTGPFLLRSFQLEYRNSKAPTENPSNPFPAALLDAIAGYDYLVRGLGFAPEDIILEGDSAGGNLALALMRYLVESQGQADGAIPRPPSALILSSPWSDLGPEPVERTTSRHLNLKSDFISLIGPGYVTMTGDFLGALGHIAGQTNRYISPASQSPSMGHISFKGFPRTFIVNGGSDVLRDQIRVLRDKMEADLGSKLKFVEFPDAWHDFLCFPEIEPERTEALHLIADWLQSEF
ncbi:Alpha/Beta hydrolase protein [Irpex rosettiformis]|uniref:Alpha/Beta hydrolase protein n=1 Tax=Irpex rosettiformis TaxID=378272 RepID=A0ACB8UFL5_9APHY|nr:Alpha/Beta hydrolase protein [Irpex rosettiformis]